jgi:hypothetical protein
MGSRKADQKTGSGLEGRLEEASKMHEEGLK